MEIRHPRRILAISPPDSGILDVIKDLTGSAPTSNDTTSTAGLSHEWDVHTTYYSAKVPIWVDEITDTDAWKKEFLETEAKEVVEAVGAWVYCFREPPAHRGIDNETESVMKAVQEISEAHAGYGADVVMLAVALPRSLNEAVNDATRRDECEDICLQYGFEYIDYNATGLNEFGERTGAARLKEALEANEWAPAPTSDSALLGGDEDADFGFDLDANSDFGFEEAEMTAELFGMKAALAGEGMAPSDGDEEATTSGQEEKQVDDIDRLMSKLLAVKEQSAGLPDAERKRMAARAVRELMADQ